MTIKSQNTTATSRKN